MQTDELRALSYRSRSLVENSLMTPGEASKTVSMHTFFLLAFSSSSKIQTTYFLS